MKKKINIKQKVVNMLDMPQEVIFNLPIITFIGSKEITIENYKGILEYAEEKIRINSVSGIIKIEGKKLYLKQIATEKIVIAGNILKVEYII